MHEGSKESASKLWFDFADCVFFAKKKVYMVGETKRAMDEGKHYIYTQGRAAFDAKSRYSLPFELELDYAAFDAAMKKVKTAPELEKEILGLAEGIKDALTKNKISGAVEKYKTSVHDLANILEQVKTILTKA